MQGYFTTHRGIKQSLRFYHNLRILQNNGRRESDIIVNMLVSLLGGIINEKVVF